MQATDETATPASWTTGRSERTRERQPARTAPLGAKLLSLFLGGMTVLINLAALEVGYPGTRLVALMLGSVWGLMAYGLWTVRSWGWWLATIWFGFYALLVLAPAGQVGGQAEWVAVLGAGGIVTYLLTKRDLYLGGATG